MDLIGKGQMARTTFVYKPAHALAMLPAYKAPGKPAIRILAPRSGATVGEHFQVVLDWSNFRPSCDLYHCTYHPLMHGTIIVTG
jgi:hypothetical protein